MERVAERSESGRNVVIFPLHFTEGPQNSLIPSPRSSTLLSLNHRRSHLFYLYNQLASLSKCGIGYTIILNQLPVQADFSNFCPLSLPNDLQRLFPHPEGHLFKQRNCDEVVWLRRRIGIETEGIVDKPG